VSLEDKTSPELIECEVYVDGQLNKDFQPKVVQFLLKIHKQFPWLSEYRIRVETQNTFPHSSGIASSASAFSALAFCLSDIHAKLNGIAAKPSTQEVSSLARLGSGSACRSVAGGIMVWGQHEDFDGSDDEYAISFTDFHPVFASYQDTILIVHKGEKAVSSSLGHSLIDNHPFAQIRFEKANRNMGKIKSILKDGNLEAFADLVESEALMLHAMMMTSDPNFILMKPQTLAIIEIVRAFREQTGVQVCFTLDAGANVHLLYPQESLNSVEQLIGDKLKQYCENDTYICDQVGEGPVQLNLTNA
jgi:diphosphomevalonate decarboxylase